MNLIKQFLKDVVLGNLNYMIIDSPPGTGDEPLSIAQLVPRISGGIVVTTPQDIAILDAKKSIRFSQQLKLPYIGVIENMSGFIFLGCGKRIDIFKTGGGENIAREMKVKFLGSIPYDAVMMNLCNDGRIYLDCHKNGTNVSEAYRHISNKIIEIH